MKEGDIRFAKLLVLVCGLVPLALLVWDQAHHRLGANPQNFVILTTGMMTLIFLTLTMAVTPVRKVFGLNWLIQLRRMLGLYAFFYGCLHFLCFYSLDRAFSISSTLHEIVVRKYIWFGMTALLVMVPLAITSTNAMIRRLGGKRWRALHRLAYVAAICGVIHYYMQVKADTRQPLVFIAVLAVLLAYRVLVHGKSKSTTPAASKKIWSGPLCVASIVRETQDVCTFRFVTPDGSDLPFQHRPGQYLVISPVINGKKVNRTYTISSPPTRTNYCEITVKREENGFVSRHLHETVREGDTINISAPAGRFIFDGTQAASIVLIAGGVGITPLMSILRYLTDKNWKGEIHFIFCVKTERDIIFRKEMDELKARFPNLHLHVALSRAEGTDWMGHKGRINGEFLAKVIPNPATHLVYICGPTLMMAPTIQLLRDLGVPAEQIKSEEFIAAKKAETTSKDAIVPPLPATPVMMPDTNAEPMLTFSRSGKSVALDPDKCLLEIAEEAGVNTDYGCRSGICGRCKTRLLRGNVTMEFQDALDEDEKSKNIILMCQARATERVTVEA